MSRILHFRFYTGVLGHERIPSWLFGGSGDFFSYKGAMVCKYLEGTVEAAPQLSLQFYIVLQKGLDFTERTQGRTCITIHV